jgi:pyrroloquinoline quinone biosynthesis protein D
VSGAISPETRPRLAAKARVRWDRKGERHMLLYPERGLVLNATAADVVRLCTGDVTVADIVDQLATKYAPQPREAVEREVVGFLTRLAERGLLGSGDE